MRKGALSIEIVIILVLGVLVVAAVVGFLLGAFKPAAGGTSLDVAKTLACQKLKSQGCTEANLGRIVIDNFDANKDGKFNPGTCCGHSGEDQCGSPTYLPTCPAPEDNLYELCIFYYGCQGHEQAGDGALGARVSYVSGVTSGVGLEFAKCCRKQVCGCEGIG
jgi:hypothetical protein